MDEALNCIKLIMEIGFLATNYGRLDTGSEIFGYLSRARPQSAYPKIGLGCVAMGYGKFETAAEILSIAPCTEQKEHDLCQGFLGMALKLGGETEKSIRVLEKLKAEGKNEVALAMAEKLLKEIQISSDLEY